MDRKTAEIIYKACIDVIHELEYVGAYSTNLSAHEQLVIKAGSNKTIAQIHENLLAPVVRQYPDIK